MITPELSQVIEEAIQNELLDVHVSLPGTVQSYDESTKTATIELNIAKLLEDPVGAMISEELPVLQNVPVVFPRTKKAYCYMPIEPGDTGDVIFSETSIGQWRSLGKNCISEEFDRHTLSGGKFYPGLVDDATAEAFTPPPGVSIGYVNGAFVAVEEDGRTIQQNALGFAELKADGQFNVNDNFTVDP